MHFKLTFIITSKASLKRGDNVPSFDSVAAKESMNSDLISSDDFRLDLCYRIFNFVSIPSALR